MAPPATLTAMRTRWLLNLLLLLIVVGIAVLYLKQDYGETEAPTLLSDMDSKAITYIRVERPGEPVIELERSSGDWRLTAPIETDADDNRVESILQLPESISQSRFSAADKNLERYGLNPPQLTVTFDEQRFSIGDAGALDDKQLYVLHDDQVHLISGHLHRRLAAPLTYYVPAELIPADRTVTGIRLPDGTLNRVDENWQASPGALSDSPAQVAAAWQMAQAVYVKLHDSAAAEYQGEVKIDFAAGKPLHYRIMRLKSQLVLANPALGLQYHLDQNLAQQLLLEPVGEADTTTNE